MLPESERRDTADRERRGRATLLACLAAAVWMFLYEAAKQAFLPNLSAWQSHAMTIAVSACTAAIVTYVAIIRQAGILRSLADEQALRATLELRQEALAHSEARYRLLVEASPEAIVVHSVGVLLYVNAAAARLMGVADGGSLVGVTTGDMFFAAESERSLSADDVSPEWREYRVLRSDGERIDVEAASVNITYAARPAVQTVLRDISHRKVLEARLIHDAFHDPLTGLPNRALFCDRVTHALSRLQRTANYTTTVLFLDLDDFKSVNDTLGHAAGDRVLAAVGDRLCSVTRECDTVARLGGDEFAILLEEPESRDEVLAIVTRVYTALAAPLRVNGRDLAIAASIGVAFATAEDNATTLLRNADVAMYEAKESGTSRHAIYDPCMYEAIVQRLALEAELREAALDPAAAGFLLVYQPIVELSSGNIRGLEALLRWNHPTRGFTTPDAFIPMAERIGTIVPLGQWVLEEACRQLEVWRTLWQTAGRDPRSLPGVSVNLSAKQLQKPGLVADVQRALRLTKAGPDRVTLEVTESVIMQQTEATLDTLTQLKRLGVQLAIDDFGTGYSSLSYLQKFPVDILKIDRVFVEGVARSGSDLALARTIVMLGSTLGLRTIAEGIEDDKQREQLELLGCDFGQGFLFAKPMIAAAASAWLQQTSTAGFGDTAVEPMAAEC
ncbi:MAG: EAL domain-containing protein [Gemmatimonadaceae bacterium]|nr:EAL domain-containing protein [Gemmatimonadaceae bacterium]